MNGREREFCRYASYLLKSLPYRTIASLAPTPLGRGGGFFFFRDCNNGTIQDRGEMRISLSDPYEGGLPLSVDIR